MVSSICGLPGIIIVFLSLSPLEVSIFRHSRPHWSLGKQKACLGKIGSSCYKIKLLKLKQIKIFQHAIISITKHSTLPRGSSAGHFYDSAFQAPNWMMKPQEPLDRRDSFWRIRSLTMRCVNAQWRCARGLCAFISILVTLCSNSLLVPSKNSIFNSAQV